MVFYHISTHSPHTINLIKVEGWGWRCLSEHVDRTGDFSRLICIIFLAQWNGGKEVRSHKFLLWTTQSKLKSILSIEQPERWILIRYSDWKGLLNIKVATTSENWNTKCSQKSQQHCSDFTADRISSRMKIFPASCKTWVAKIHIFNIHVPSYVVRASE